MPVPAMARIQLCDVWGIICCHLEWISCAARAARGGCGYVVIVVHFWCVAFAVVFGGAHVHSVGARIEPPCVWVIHVKFISALCSGVVELADVNFVFSFISKINFFFFFVRG